jgi:translation initiation factor IF-3
VKATIFFRGREMAHPEIGRRILERLMAELADAAVAENVPRKEGNTMHVILARKPGWKPAGAAKPAPRPAAAVASQAAETEEPVEELGPIDEAGEPEAAEPEVGEPEAAEPEAGEPEAGDEGAAFDDAE